MEGYKKLLKTIKDEGEVRDIERSGYGTKEIFAPQIRFDLSKGHPIVTTKSVPFRMVAEELFWFLSGDSRIKPLIEKKVPIWTSDALRFNLEEVLKEGLFTKENVDEARRLAKEKGELKLANELLSLYEAKILEDDDFSNRAGRLGPVYGVQWRGENKNSVDQIRKLEDDLSTGASSRRMIVSAWNPIDIPDMALPPCHMLCQANVSPESNKLSLLWYQRSVDTVLGLPFNISSYALMSEILAKTHGFKVGEVIGDLGNTHIYLPHMLEVEEQLEKNPFPLPTLNIKNKKESILDYTFEDIELIGYKHHGRLKNPTPMFGGFF